MLDRANAFAIPFRECDLKLGSQCQNCIINPATHRPIRSGANQLRGHARLTTHPGMEVAAFHSPQAKKERVMLWIIVPIAIPNVAFAWIRVRHKRKALAAR